MGSGMVEPPTLENKLSLKAFPGLRGWQSTKVERRSRGRYTSALERRIKGSSPGAYSSGSTEKTKVTPVLDFREI